MRNIELYKRIQSHFDDFRARMAACVAYVRGPKTLEYAQDPVFIGGTGGSGTRVVARIIECTGYFIGSNLHGSLDSLDMDRFFDAWLMKYLAEDGSIQSMRTNAKMDKHLERALIWHRSCIPSANAPWALKHPRSVLMLPYLQSKYSNMKFIHVVRDGRDMAFSGNMRQVNFYGHLIGTLGEANQTQEAKAMYFWAHSNMQAKQFANSELGERYLLVRLEDLCAEPEVQIHRIYQWIGAGNEKVQAASETVITPQSMGRWRSKPGSLVRKITAIGADSLHAFGYT